MTERKTTGASPLVDIIQEVYDTKKRMKTVINTVIETNSDDFEEYATLTTNVRATMWNKGIKEGWTDGWHSVFPNDVITEDMYEEYLRDYATFTPSIPHYSTDTYIDNLVDIMTDNLRCRLLLKAALETNSNEFVTYPDLLELLIESEYQTAYDMAYEEAYQEAVDLSFAPPTILQHRDKIEIINNTDFGDVYYWVGNQTIDDKVKYTGQFTISGRTYIHAVLYFNGRYSEITFYIAIMPEEEELTIILDDLPMPEIDSDTSSIWLYLADPPGTQSPSSLPYECSINDGAWFDAEQSRGGNGYGICLYVRDGDESLNNNPTVRNLKKYDGIRLRANSAASNALHTAVALCKIARISHTYGMVTAWTYPKFRVGGNFLSLFSKTGYYDITDLTTLNMASYSGGTYASVFNVSDNNGQYQCTSIENIGFHATTLNPYCYAHMFEYTGASVAPPLSDTYLTRGCYESMFRGSKITSMPQLASTNLAHSCYMEMFVECTSLTGSVSLPATRLEQDCYRSMFVGCTGITSATVLGEYCRYLYYDGNGYLQRPDGQGCMYGMFDGCTSLTSIECHYKSINNGDWMDNITQAGIMRISRDAYYIIGSSGIPSNWTIQYYDSEPQTDFSQEYFTIEALKDGFIWLNNNLISTPNIYYSKNNGEWQLFDAYDGSGNTSSITTSKSLLVNGGDKIRFYASNTRYWDTSNNHNCRIRTDFIYNATGNIMSLIDGQSFTNGGTVSDYAFEMFFGTLEDRNSNNNVVHARHLILPATTLGNSCYDRMFRRCTALLDVPTNLPATALAYGCYGAMFYGCDRIEESPVLPAPTLIYACYYQMFKGCTSLNEITCLATDMSANDCLGYWVQGVAATGTFIKNSSATWTTGDSGIPSGWTVVDAA